jgi:hypothetical protein
MDFIYPLAFCQECGKQALSSSDHQRCFEWGFMRRKYKIKDDWWRACLENGLRISYIIKQDKKFTV